MQQEVASRPQISVCAQSCILPSQQVGDVDLTALAAAWSTRHGVVAAPEEQENIDVPDHSLSACAKVGFCICSHRGQLVSWFWTTTRMTLRQRFTGEALKKLRSGRIWMLWRGVRNENDIVVAHCTHCPLQYLKPWRPTFWQVTLDAFSQAKASQNDIRGVFLSAVLGADEPAAFFTPYTLLDSFDLDLRYEVLLCELSTQPTPFLNSAGHVRIRVLDEPAFQIWEGTAREQEKRARHRAPPEIDEREAAEPEAEPDLLDLWVENLAQEAENPETESDSDSSTTSASTTRSSRSSSSPSRGHQDVPPPPSGFEQAARCRSWRWCGASQKRS